MEAKIVLWVIIFLSTFFIVLGSMVAESAFMFSETPFIPSVSVPDRWDTAEIGKGSVTSQDWGNLSYPTVHQLYLSWQGTNDTHIYVVWTDDQTEIEIFHPHVWYYWAIMLPYPVTQTYVVSIEDSDLQRSYFYTRCQDGDIPEILVQFAYDTVTYDDLTDAWDNGELDIWIGYEAAGNQTIAHYNVWTLIGQLMSFNLPNVHPSINIIIGVPIYACIIIGVIYALDKLVPF